MNARLVGLISALHRVVYVRSKRSLMAKDHPSIVLRFSQVFKEVVPSQAAMDPNLMTFILKGKPQFGREDHEAKMDDEVYKKLEVNVASQQYLNNLTTIEGFDDFGDQLSNNIDKWASYVDGAPEELQPEWMPEGGDDKSHEMLMQLCIAKVLRPDQILSMVRKL